MTFDEPLRAMIQDWTTHELRLAVIIAAAGEPNEDNLRRSAYLVALVDGKGHQVVWAGETMEEAIAAAMEWEEDYVAVVPLGVVCEAAPALKDWARKELAKDPFPGAGDDKEPA